MDQAAKNTLTDQIVKLIVGVHELTKKSILDELETAVISPMKIQLANAHSRIATLELESRMLAEEKKKNSMTNKKTDHVDVASSPSSSSSVPPVEFSCSSEGKDFYLFKSAVSGGRVFKVDDDTVTSDVSKLFPENFTAEGLKRDVDMENLAALCKEMMDNVIETQSVWQSNTIYREVDDDDVGAPAHRERLDAKAEIIVAELNRRRIKAVVTKSYRDVYTNSSGRVNSCVSITIYNPNIKH
jgi:hypothetical protein